MIDRRPTPAGRVQGHWHCIRNSDGKL